MPAEILGSPNFTIAQAEPEDAYGIVTVQKEAWLDTYPNPDLGITPEDILLKFGDFQDKVKNRKEYLARLSGNQSIGYWVAKDENGVIGFIFAKKGAENMIEALNIVEQFKYMLGSRKHEPFLLEGKS